MSKQYDLIIFDWDGTLVDSADLIVMCMQLAFSDAQLVVPGAEEIRNIIGLGLNEAIIELNGHTPESKIKELRERYSYHFHKNDIHELSVFDGVYELLMRLQGQGRLSAVATGKSRKGLARGLSRFKQSELFTTTRCADETKSKPHPLMLEEILREVNVPLERAVMVGDSIYDMEMAQRLGMDSIGVTYGVHCYDRLSQFKPVTVVDNVSSLSSFLLNKH
ncbi:HAD family hydrolase [Litoribrevibacter euphylliae]|uniref:HAD family hydrolase n=1 Tax=Litoribrevibacter euphylliae TaxID=1834034 RepID=A0ABV7HG11_9GAMM